MAASDTLSLQIAGGILLAVAVVALFKFAVARFVAKDYQMALPALALSALLGGGMMLASLGVVAY